MSISRRSFVKGVSVSLGGGALVSPSLLAATGGPTSLKQASAQLKPKEAAGVAEGGQAASSRFITLEEQGSFFAGGTVATAPGKMNAQKPLSSEGQTLHGDHAYVFYQRPVKARKYPLVFLHGSCQSGKTWETTPDGREGFQNIFLRRGYSVYLVDQPRRGRAGQSTRAATLPAAAQDQYWFSYFRIGNWQGADLPPSYFDGVAFPQTEEARNQFLRQMTPNTGDYDPDIISNAVAAVFERSGEGVLITHSQGGGIGWLAAIKSSKIKGIASYEPGSGFVFPEGEVPKPLETTHPGKMLSARSVPKEDFLKLTRIPIVIYYGDNICEKMSNEWNKDGWRVRLEMARLWAQAVNRHGGNAKVIHLPDIGIKGNTHFLFADLNNVQIADLLEAWLIEKHLAVA